MNLEIHIFWYLFEISYQPVRQRRKVWATLQKRGTTGFCRNVYNVYKGSESSLCHLETWHTLRILWYSKWPWFLDFDTRLCKYIIWGRICYFHLEMFMKILNHQMHGMHHLVQCTIQTPGLRKMSDISTFFSAKIAYFSFHVFKTPMWYYKIFSRKWRDARNYTRDFYGKMFWFVFDIRGVMKYSWFQ